VREGGCNTHVKGETEAKTGGDIKGTQNNEDAERGSATAAKLDRNATSMQKKRIRDFRSSENLKKETF